MLEFIDQRKQEIENYFRSEILLEKRLISAEMALRISKTVGGSPESWLQMQAALDLWDVTQRFKADPKKLPRPIPNYAFA